MSSARKYLDLVSTMDVSLAEHDARFHKPKYDPKTMTCEFRERRAALDPVDGDIDENVGISGIFTGSSADYSRPSLIHVGSGEGTQVYGWGLYGSNVRGVAESYIPPKDQVERANQYREYLKRRIAEETDPHEKEYLEFDLRQAEKAKPVQSIYEQTFFTNRVKGDESHLLSWYEPISKENAVRIADQLKKENKSIGIDLRMLAQNYCSMQVVTPAHKIYQKLVENLYSPKAASEFLARADIDGIKYPVDSYGGKTIKDGDKAGWNYVSFRDDNIRVNRKFVNGEEVDVRDESPLLRIAREAMDESLEEHDEKYHPEGYHEGDTCNKRANQAKGDEADAGVAGNESASEALSKEDAAYLDAVRRGDMMACEKMVREAAERAGYSADVGYRISHHAPTNDGYNASLVDVEPMFDTSNRFDLLRMGYGRPTAYDAVNAIMNAKGNPDAMIEVYRAVPKSVKDVNLRRGDWVSLSESYARQHEEAWLDGKYRIVKGKVPAKHLFTDGNMLEEAGFDDGQDRAYKNTKNGTKLLGVTYDDAGNVIPLSKRFDMRNPDIRY